MTEEIGWFPQLYLMRRERLERDADPRGAGEVLSELLEFVPQHEAFALEVIARLSDRFHTSGWGYAITAVGE